MPLGVTISMRSVTSSTLGRVSVGYHSSVSITRLQPSSSVGVTLRRSSGSLMARLICQRPTARKGGRSHARLVIAIAPSSWKAKFAWRSRRWSAGKRSNRRLVRSR